VIRGVKGFLIGEDERGVVIEDTSNNRRMLKDRYGSDYKSVFPTKNEAK
jgi:hypothetical protein